jgi:hypothetical protein
MVSVVTKHEKGVFRNSYGAKGAAGNLSTRIKLCIWLDFLFAVQNEDVAANLHYIPRYPNHPLHEVFRGIRGELEYDNITPLWLAGSVGELVDKNMVPTKRVGSMLTAGIL